MNLLNYLRPKTSVKRKILDIKHDIEQVVRPKCPEKFNVIWYGAYDIDPKHLVYWICMQTDQMKQQLEDDGTLNDELRSLLKKHQYPEQAQPFVGLGFESQETVDRESAGNWYHHFK